MNQLLSYLFRVVSLLVLGLIANPAWADVVTYFHNDIAGTPMAATDANGNLVWKESYRPYGERLLNQAGPADNRLWFGGKSQDPDTGLSYLGARYYNPQLGRFTGIDPKEVDPEDPHRFNRYAYGNNNPYKFVDPDGKVALPILVAVGIGLWISGEILTPMPDLPPGSGRIEPTTFPDLSGALGAGLKGLGVAAMATRNLENTGVKVGIETAAKGVINPSTVRFSQDSASAAFSKGGSIQEMADALRSGALKADQVPAIRLVEKDGKLFTLDNRRLEAFRRAEVDVPYRMATPQEAAREAWKFTTRNDGVTIRIRGE